MISTCIVGCLKEDGETDKEESEENSKKNESVETHFQGVIDQNEF